jgi:hypothetical protein
MCKDLFVFAWCLTVGDPSILRKLVAVVAAFGTYHLRLQQLYQHLKALSYNELTIATI